jgi:protein involved in polysaccharide export with SLBB domain
MSIRARSVSWVLICTSVVLFWALEGAGAAPGRAFPLAPGDTLKFDILDDDREPVDLMVAPEGTIQAPFLGAVAVSGLGVEEAREALHARFIERGIFVEPRIGLSVAAYRPVFVVGDVRQPGAFPFQADLTVEKVMGLAGGQLVAGQGEDPVLARSRLHGEIAKADTLIIRQALAIARLTAQLADREAITDDDIPVSARAYLEGPIADSMRIVEQRILETDRSGFAAQKAVLIEGIAEAERGQKLLEELGGKVSTSIAMSQADLDRGKGLQQRGIKTLSDVSNLERQLNAEEARQLQVLSELSDGRQGLGTLKQQLAGLEQTRKIQALNDLQAHTADLAAAVSSRRSTEEQIMLISALSADKVREAREVVLDFTIRRNGAGDITAKGASAVEPGDVVVVTLRSLRDGSPVELFQAAPAAAGLSQ